MSKILIPKPCSQHWNSMDDNGNGKYCQQCQNTVYDFSQLSDEEVLNFLQTNKDVHCGRFHQSQVNRELSPLKTAPVKIFRRINKAAAALLAVLSFKSGFSNNNTDKKSASHQTYKTDQLLYAEYLTGKVTISGIVKDDNGKALAGVVVAFDSLVVTKTDTEGKFSFDMESPSGKTHSIYFNHSDFNSTVRTYHPSMQSTTYEVALSKPGQYQSHIMGGITMPSEYLRDLPSLNYKAKEIKLSSANKMLLVEVAMKMKQNPDAEITITAYPPVSYKVNYAAKRAKLVAKYLQDQLGIAADRIKINLEVDGGDVNVVDFVPVEE